MQDGLYEMVADSISLSPVALESLSGRGRRVVWPVDDAEVPNVLGSSHLRSLCRASSPGPLEMQRSASHWSIVWWISCSGEVDQTVVSPASQPEKSLPPCRARRCPAIAARPSTPLSEAALLTNAPGEPGVGHEIRAELASADRVDLSGLRQVARPAPLETALALSARARRPFRVITTTYMGATERAALDRLVRELRRRGEGPVRRATNPAARQGVAVPPRHRLRHRLRRLINLSRAALLDGVEWNVRLSQVGTPPLAAEVRGDVRHLLERPDLRALRPRPRPRPAGRRAGRGVGGERHDRVTIYALRPRGAPVPVPAGDARRLEVERDGPRPAPQSGGGGDRYRQDGRRRARLPAPVPRMPADAPATAVRRAPPRDPRAVAAHLPRGARRRATSASSTSAGAARALASMSSPACSPDVVRDREHPRGCLRIVVIDEFHHAEATTYRRDPRPPRPELLGLTATPSAPTAMDVRSFFDGRTAAELRLWDALGADLLCPFHYFAVADGTDLTRRQLEARGLRRSASCPTSTPATTLARRIVLQTVRDKVADLSGMRALGFCVSVAHADYMADVFNEAGIPAAAVLGQTPRRPTVTQRPAGPRGSRESRWSSPSTCSTKGSTSRRRHRALPPAHRERHRLPAAARTRAASTPTTRPCSPCSTSSATTARSSASTNKLRALTGRPAPRLERDIEQGFPFLPVRLPDRARPASPEPRSGQHQESGHQALAEDRSPSCGPTRPRPGHVPRRVRRGAGRRDPARRSLVGSPPPRGRAPTLAPGPQLEETLLKRVRAFATSTIASARTPTRWLSR